MAGADEWMRAAASSLDAAQVLKKAGKANEAYFHAGQAIEFALKALYLKRNNLADMPDNHKGAHWHNLNAIADEARLKADISRPETSRALKANWLTVKDWQSNARFPGNKVQTRELNDLFVAVCNDRDGVWPWLQSVYQRS